MGTLADTLGLHVNTVRPHLDRTLPGMGTLADTLGPVVAAPPFTRARCHTIQALERLEKVGDPDDLAAVTAALDPDSGGTTRRRGWPSTSAPSGRPG